MSSAIKKYYEDKVSPILQDKTKEQLVNTELARLVTNAYTQNMQSDESFCFKFSIPLSSVNNLYTSLGLNPADVSTAFKSDWGGEKISAMHKDSYYQILLLLIYHAIIKKRDVIAQNALMLILIKIWNGRVGKFFPWCDKKIMKYVVSTMMTNRHSISKYENPVTLLKNNLVPTLLSKYAPEIRLDPGKLKRLFEQSYARIFQLFIFNKKVNLKTGESEAQGGLLALYMKAHRDGLHISIPKTYSNEDGESPTFDQYTTTHYRDEIVQKTTDMIVMNSRPQYPQDLIKKINAKTNVSVKIIEKILLAIHEHENYEIIKDLIILFLSRTNVSTVNDICSGSFSQNLQRNVISSKNNSDVNKIQKLLDIMLDRIFKEKLELDFNKFSQVHKIKIRNVVIFGIEYNLFKINCKGS